MASYLQHWTYDTGGRIYGASGIAGIYGDVSGCDTAWGYLSRCAFVFSKTLAIGIPFDDTLDAMFYNYQTVAVTLIVYGILFIVVENYNKKRKPRVTSLSEITYSLAIGIGIFQVLSLIPGTSRSGSTILGAILLGASRGIAAEFSFFLGIPVMFGASLLKLVKFGFAFSSAELLLLLVGMVTAFFVSILAIKFLMGYIKKNDFKPFGYYRIILGVLVLFYFIVMK